MMNAIFRDVTLSGSCKKRRFGVTAHHNHKVAKNQRAATTLVVTCNLLLFTANVFPKLADSLHLNDGNYIVLETSALTRDTRRHIPEDF
jgi:hypothetical protein